jgi:hypothetical protein
MIFLVGAVVAEHYSLSELAYSSVLGVNTVPTASQKNS